jgi:hypothetical protein
MKLFPDPHTTVSPVLTVRVCPVLIVIPPSSTPPILVFVGRVQLEEMV